MYARLNEAKTDIEKRFGVGINTKTTSFSVNSTHDDYVKEGLYKIIDNPPKLKKGEKAGDRQFVIDESAKTVDISRQAAEKTKIEKLKDKRDAQKPHKLAGVEINGILCSATRKDQDGLTAVAMGTLVARGAGTTFPDTVFEFQNGAELLITDSNFDAYYAIWMPFRQSFYQPKA
jgi:hypothetical protein